MKWTKLLSLPLLPFAVLVPDAAAAFESGDLYLLSNALPTIGVGILRVDPGSGATSVLADLPNPVRPSFSYDAFRDRLLYLEGATAGVRTADEAGGLATIPTPGELPVNVAARGDGLVYLWFGPGTGPSTGFGYLDASNVRHALLDASGSAPFTFASSFQEMIYDPSTNSLLCLSGLVFGPCTTVGQACAVRIPLTADGTQVAGPVQWAQLEVSPSGESVDGASLAPGGDLLVIVDTNSNDREPRMQRLDPATMTFAAFASNGPYTGAAATDAGTWHAALGRALILDTGNNVLRSFGSAEVGAGAIFASGVSAGGSAEDARLLQISSGPAVPALPAWGVAALVCALAALAARAAPSRAA